jgi:glycosyltransferase involved in cell wall biosynthesis
MKQQSLSLVVPTLGRTQQLERLLNSLQGQTLQCFEVIVVDQNDDRRVADIIESRVWAFPLTRLARPTDRGVSRGRNVGWRHTNREILMFPDDDCWYPPDLIARGLATLENFGADLLCGRVADQYGRSINGRFADYSAAICRNNVWVCQCEGVTFVKRSLLESVDGFDENVGIGARSPWQAAEGPDFILRAMKHEAKCCYDPALYGYHDEFAITRPDDRTIRKVRAYGRGMGFVLRRHGYGPTSMLYWVSRSLANALWNLASARFRRARFYLAVALGRIEGWTGRASTDGSF